MCVQQKQAVRKISNHVPTKKIRVHLALMLFYLYLAAKLHKLPPDNPGADIRYRYVGGLCNLSRLRPKRLTYTQHVSNFNTQMTTLPSVIQRRSPKVCENFTMVYRCFRLTVNIKKTKALAHPTPNTILPDTDITISDIIRPFSISMQLFSKNVHLRK